MAGETLELRGRAALVTGASRGIGLAIAEELAEAGAEVHCLSRNPGPVESIAASTGGRVWAADVTDDAVLWSTLDALREHIGDVPDLVVNSSGAFALSHLADTRLNDFDRMIQVNLRGAFIVIRSFLPGMLSRGSGEFVTIGSVAGRRAFPANGAYSASKFGLRGMHEVMLEEIRGTGVRACMIEPAATDTPLWDPLDPDADPNLPGREDMLRAQDVADAVRYVVSRPPHVRIPLLQIERG